MGRGLFLALAVLSLLGAADGAYAEDFFPPPPPPLDDVPPAGEAQPVDGEPVVDEDIVDVPAEPDAVPTREAIEAPAPAPAAGSTLERRLAALERRFATPDCRPACGQRRDDCCWPIDCNGRRYGRTRVTIEGSFGLLNSPEGLLGTPAFGFPQQFSWDELDYEGSIGGRLTIEHQIIPQSWLQFRGAYYGSWDDDTSRVGVLGFQPGNAFGAGIPGGRIGASADVQGTLDSEADLYGAEFNYIEEFSCRGCTRWDLIMGVRWLQFNEEANANFATPPIPLFAGPSSVLSDVENMFIGVQIGTRFHYQPSDSIEFLATFKALAGNLNRKIDVRDQNIFAGGVHSASADTDEIVLGADIELGLRWRPIRCIAFTLGYNLLMLDNVSRANDAMDFSHSTSGAVQAGTGTDQLIWHGVFAGVSFEF